MKKKKKNQTNQDGNKYSDILLNDKYTIGIFYYSSFKYQDAFIYLKIEQSIKDIIQKNNQYFIIYCRFLFLDDKKINFLKYHYSGSILSENPSEMALPS